jgi:ATP-dependent DNA ligase
MTTFEKVEQDVTCYKPKMHSAKDLKDIPLSFNRNTTCQVKADGEFNYIKYSREGETFALNRFGRKTVALPALMELAGLMVRWNIVEAEMLGEFYAVDEQGKPLTLPKLIHYLKGSDTILQQFVKIGLFELVSLNGAKSELIFPLKFQTMQEWVKDGSLVHVLDWIEPANLEQVQEYWKDKVETDKWEGLVVRFNGDVWKVKPNVNLDAAIIGINKNNKGFELKKAKSLKLALMNDDGSFVEIGDCSGVGEQEAGELWSLTDFKLGEDNQTVYVQPVVIATIEYIDTYLDTKNKCYVIDGKSIREVGEQTLVRLKSPHIIGYRADKKACLEDIGLNQVS